MAKKGTIADAAKRAIAAAQTLEAKHLRTAQEFLSAFYQDHMQPVTATNFRVTKSGVMRPLPNPTEKLYQLKGNLRRAFIPKQPGNIGRIAESPKGPVVIIGIDLEDVPYARIHELGGKAGKDKSVTIPARPYQSPGMEAYLQEHSKDLQDSILEQAIWAWNT